MTKKNSTEKELLQIIDILSKKPEINKKHYTKKKITKKKKISNLAITKQKISQYAKKKKQNLFNIYKIRENIFKMQLLNSIKNKKLLHKMSRLYKYKRGLFLENKYISSRKLLNKNNYDLFDKKTGKFLPKNILGFSFNKIAKKKYNNKHINSLDWSSYQKKAIETIEQQRQKYFQDLKIHNRKVRLENERKYRAAIVQKVLAKQRETKQNIYVILKKLKLKDFVSIYREYKRDLIKYPNKKYLQIKTNKDLVKAKIQTLTKSLKKTKKLKKIKIKKNFFLTNKKFITLKNKDIKFLLKKSTNHNLTAIYRATSAYFIKYFLSKKIQQLPYKWELIYRRLRSMKK